MRIFNTLSRQVEEIVPLRQPTSNQKPELGLYACGPTVYDYAHIGHMRKYSMDDVLIRALRHSGYIVKFVQNITDVGHLASDADTGEDKLEKGARKYKQTVWDVARKFEDYFFDSMDKMGNVRPDFSCRATAYIAEQLVMVQTLEAKGYTYVIEGDGVYFDTSKFASYAELANLQIDKQQVGERVGEDLAKKNPADFALWKFERPGENRAMVWPSPWHPRSFPGWHIECSAMSMAHLGEQFELHTGGIDHIPVHHTNEIAQSEAATGKHPFVKYWIHHNFLRVNGEKMSKSLGNFYTLEDIIERGATPQALRLLFLATHYRSEMNFTWESLTGAQTSWKRLQAKVSKLQQLASEGDDLNPDLSANIAEQQAAFFAAINNDLQTPQALAIFWQILDTPLSAENSAHQVYRSILQMDEVLGLGLAKISHEESAATKEEISPEIEELIARRKVARQEKNWAEADKLRDQLIKLGFTPQDGSAG